MTSNTESQQIAVNTSRLDALTKMTDKIFVLLQEIKAAQGNSKAELLLCRNELEKSILKTIKIEYQSIEEAKGILRIAVAWMAGFTFFGILSAYLINVYNLVSKAVA